MSKDSTKPTMQTGFNAKTRRCPIRANSCPFVVFYCMETIGRSGRHRLHWLSLNGDSPVHPQKRTRSDPIRVNSCPFVVFYRMDTAKGV